MRMCIFTHRILGAVAFSRQNPAAAILKGFNIDSMLRSLCNFGFRLYAPTVPSRFQGFFAESMGRCLRFKVRLAWVYRGQPVLEGAAASLNFSLLR